VSIAKATSIALPSVPELVGCSDAVVEGEVVGIEPDRVELNIPLYKRRSPEKVKFAVASFRVRERLLGASAGEAIRIAFVPDDQQPTDGLSLDTPVLNVGQMRLLYLGRDREKDLLVANSHFSGGIPGEDAETSAKLTRRVCKLLQTPAESLHAKSDEDRMLTAWTLAARYQRPLAADNKLEDLSEEESRAILDGLALIPDSQARHLCHVASGLGSLTGAFDVRTSTASGFNTDGVRTWLRDNRDTLRLKRYAGRELPAR
jgi:hypothetical protein